MGKRSRWHDHPDPEHRRWSATYPAFPGVAECLRLIRTGRARGVWIDIVVLELAENAEACFEELVAAYREDDSGSLRVFVLMALEIAKLPKSVPFFVETLNDDDPTHCIYAERALRAIDTKEARTALFQAFGERR